MGLINDDEHVRMVCKMGLGKLCCRYLTIGATGWDCVKLSTEPVRSLLDVMEGTPSTLTAKQILDQRAEEGSMMARGDNCEGR